MNNEVCFQYQLEKPVNDDYEEEDEDDEGFGGGNKKVEEVEEDPLEGLLEICVFPPSKINIKKDTSLTYIRC